MTIASISPLASLQQVERLALLQQTAFEKVKAEPPPKAPFEPAPALRPTIQDKIEINRALIALRAMGRAP